MDPRWQPYLGPVLPAGTLSEACELLAAGWRAERDECWISTPQGGSRMVSLETWHALHERLAGVRPRLQPQAR